MDTLKNFKSKFTRFFSSLLRNITGPLPFQLFLQQISPYDINYSTSLTMNFKKYTEGSSNTAETSVRNSACSKIFAIQFLQ